MRFDLHVHSLISPCSVLGFDEIVERAAELGLDGICITDHDTMEIRHHLREGGQENGLIVLFGMEYATPEGDFLLFGPFENLSPGRSAAELLSLVAAAGGVAVAAHPFRTNRPVQEKLVREGLCRHVETLNGRNSPLENARVERWRRRYAFHECGGSDAHTAIEVGRVVTRFSAPVRSRRELIAALRKGEGTPEWPAVAGADRLRVASSSDLLF